MSETTPDRGNILEFKPHDAMPAAETTAPETTYEAGPAVAAFYDFCGEQEVYPQATAEVQDRMRPKLALQFVRNVVTRSAERQGRPDFKLFFDEQAIKRNIDTIQSKYGITPPLDREKLRNRNTYREKRRSLAASFSYLTEIDVAQQAYTQAVAAEDAAAQDSFETLLTAYGIALEERVGRIKD